jgi:glycosyltransferase involved in cell wall biosynthesis
MEKGPHIALAVAHKLNIPINFIGKKVESHEIAYFDKFIKPNLWPQDKVLGLVSAKAKAKLYRNAKATMMTNIWPEPFGIVAAESMASGTPVVGPALGSLSELVDSAGILVPVEDLKLNEEDTEITPSQLKFINRIAKYMKKASSIPPQVPRKRAEFLFSPKQSANGYEEAFYKAAYMQKSKNIRVK